MDLTRITALEQNTKLQLYFDISDLSQKKNIVEKQIEKHLLLK